MAERVLASQAAILAVSLCAIVLASLFSERRESEARLARSNMMLQQERNNKNIDAITSAIVHEVRQPLAAIVSDAGVTFFARETKGSNPSCSTGESATNRAKHGNFSRSSDGSKLRPRFFQQGDRVRRRELLKAAVATLTAGVAPRLGRGADRAKTLVFVGVADLSVHDPVVTRARPARQSSRLMSVIAESFWIPAFATRMSMRPNASTSLSNIVRTSSSRDTSALSATASPPRSRISRTSSSAALAWSNSSRRPPRPLGRGRARSPRRCRSCHP